MRTLTGCQLRNHLIVLVLLVILTTSQIPRSSSQKLAPDANFFKLCQSPVYVDKTDFLRVFFNNQTIHNFVTCPRRFGKTTMLKMIKTFAEVELDKNRKRFFWKDTHAYTVFQNLSIGQYPGIMARHLARYVVIMLNLNMDHVKRPTERKLMRILFNQIVEKYERYKWILKVDDKVDVEDKKYMSKVLNNSLNKLEQNLCLHRLAKILHDVYDKTKVIILVDDYDGAFTELVYLPDFQIDKYYQLVNNMLSRTFTIGRKYIDYVLVTGTSSMSYYLDLPKVQAITHRPFLDDHPLVTFCGLTQKELSPLLDEYEIDQVERFKIKDCYNGYTTRTQHRTIYNPNSIRKYLQSNRKEISKFWNQRFKGNANYFPKANEVTGYWTIGDRDFVIFEFLCFPEFFNDITVPSNTENAEEANFTLSKTYRSDSVDKFTILVKHVLNYLDYVPKLTEKRLQYLPLIRTFVFEHGYFTHSRRKDGFYGVPNCEVRMEVVRHGDKFDAKPDPTKFV